MDVSALMSRLKTGQLVDNLKAKNTLLDKTKAKKKKKEKRKIKSNKKINHTPI